MKVKKLTMFSIKSLNTDEILETRLLHLCRSSISPLLFENNFKWFISKKSAIVFFQYKNTLVSVGGILADLEDKLETLKAFLSYCRGNNYAYIFLHFPHEDIRFLEKSSLVINQLGASFTVDYKNYSMEGRRFQQLRHKINKAIKSGVIIEKIKSQQDFDIIKPNLEIINNYWIKKKKTKYLRHLITNFSTVNIDTNLHKLYIAKKDDKILAYIIYSKSFGKYTGWFHNITRKDPSSQDGVMQQINQYAMHDLEELDYLNFGFTPLVELQNKLNFNSSCFFHLIMKYLEKKGGIVYPAQSQRQYKMSWRPQIIDYEYIAFAKGRALKSLLTLLLATNSI
ncbi:DUF2156 domain-containing protein [Acinetobacter rudis]